MNLVVCLEAIEIIELLENQDERRKIRWPMRVSLAPQVHCSIEASDGLLSSEGQKQTQRGHQELIQSGTGHYGHYETLHPQGGSMPSWDIVGL